MASPIPNFGSIAQMITKTTSVMTPLLIINLIVAVISTAVFYAAGQNIWVFVPLVLLVVYSIYRYERFANSVPHMLSSTEVQKFGMEISAGLGQKNEEISENIVDELPSVTVSENMKLDTKSKEEK